MLETPHVAVAAAIATKIPNPYIAIPLALASHFVLDRIPHWNPHFYTEMKKHGKPTKDSTMIAVADSFMALGLGLIVAGRALPNTTQFLIIVIACFASVAPDQIKAPFFFFKDLRKGWLKKWVTFERSLQVDAPFWPGVATQITVIAASLWWIYR